MSQEQISLLLIIVVLLVLLVWGKWRFDIVALGALFTASVLGLVPQDQLFSGFGNPATITVVLVLIVSAGLTRSGAIGSVTDLIEPIADRPFLHIASLSFIAAILSMFMNNVGALALLMPIAIQSTARAGRPPASVLMPLSFASILGGLVTMIGTPPNILIANYRQQEIGEGFAMFDFAPVGAGVAGAGVLFMLLVGWRLVKVRKTSSGIDMFDVEEYLFELRVPKESALVDMKVEELNILLEEMNLDLLTMIKGHSHIPVVHPFHYISREDLLMLQGSHEDIDEFANRFGLEMLSAAGARQEILQSKDTELAEVVVAPDSRLEGSTPNHVRFNRKHNINLLAVSRSGTPHRNRLRNLKFEAGDVLLLHGQANELQDAITKLECYPLRKRHLKIGDRNKALPAILIFVVAIALAAFGVLSIQLALGLATVAMALASIVPIREFYDSVEWPIVVLLGAMIPIGAALEDTGTTLLLVDGILALTGDMSPIIILILLLVITMTVSDVLNNAATAILMAPIAYNIALNLNLNPDAFLMAIAVGASCAFLTPIGHQNNALIMGPGGYKFGDYWRMGLPLEIVIVCVATPLLLLFWPL